MITIRNLTRRMLHFNVPELGHDPHKVGVGELDTQSGAKGLRVERRALPRTLTLTARGTPGDALVGLDDAAARSPEVAAASSRREIAVAIEPALSQSPSTLTEEP